MKIEFIKLVIFTSKEDVHWEPSQTSKTELLAEIVFNGFQPLTSLVRNFIPDVSMGSQ